MKLSLNKPENKKKTLNSENIMSTCMSVCVIINVASSSCERMIREKAYSIASAGFSGSSYNPTRAGEGEGGRGRVREGGR